MKLIPNTNNIKNFKFKHQSGLSLIELMISSVIGLFLLGGVITNFVGSKDSDRTRFAISEMDASARAALLVMRQSIQHAGYPSIHNKPFDEAFYSAIDGSLGNPVCRDGVARDMDTLPSEAKRQTKDRSRGDVITVVSLADNPCRSGLTSCAADADINPEAQVYTDCMGGGATRDAHVVACSADHTVGMADSTNARIYSTFYLGGGSNKYTLYCSGSRGGTQPLADNIEAMQFLYGLRQSNGNVIYKKATEVEATNAWGLVTSVQVAILVHSSAKYLLKKASYKTQYTLLDNEWDIDPTDLRRLYRVYTTTIHLANRNRGRLLR